MPVIRTRRHACLPWLMLLASLLFWTGGPTAGAAERHVLIIYSLGSDSGSNWQGLLHRGLFDQLQSASPDSRPALYEERLDVNRVGEQEASASMEPYLRSKYARVKFDAVITENYAAARFLSVHPTLFSGVPRYYVNHGMPGWHPSDGTDLVIGHHFGRSLEIIPRTLPQVERIVVVGDQSERVQQWIGEIRAAMPLHAKGVQLEVWDRQSFAELYRRAAGLDARSALYLLMVQGDSTGARTTSAKVARNLAARSGAPIFTHVQSLVLPGIAGGYVLSADQVGRMIGRVLLQQPADPADAYTYLFNHDVAEKWGLRAIPEQATILNQPQGLWRQYRWQLTGAALLIGVQAALIWALVLALRGRRQTLGALHEERNNLEERVANRTYELLIANNKLEHLATTDPLTGIANRRKMMEQIGHELERAHRFHHPLTLMMIDIDHFKRINDTHGHDAGDRVIVAVTETLTTAMRAIDLASRFGGEEFVLLMPETGLAVAQQVAERLRLTVAALCVALSDGVGQSASIGVTVSVGVSACAADTADTASTLLMRADKALYRAKKAGRDCVMTQ